MEEIRKFVDEMMVWAGVSGDSVPVLRHLLLTVTAILLAIISDFLCRKILVPLISKITEKTEASWDDVLSIRRYSTRLAILCRLSSSGRSCHSSIWNIRFSRKSSKELRASISW